MYRTLSEIVEGCAYDVYIASDYVKELYNH
jgi:hypothetical protein